jgi:glycosyltransferase involved in cell wall biosynthesis
MERRLMARSESRGDRGQEAKRDDDEVVESRRLRLIFVLPMLAGIGGIQASLMNLIRELDPARYEITICAFSNRVSQDTSFPPGVALTPGPRILEYCLADFHAAFRTSSRGRALALVGVKAFKNVFGYRAVMDATLKRFDIAGEFDVAIAYANDIYSADGDLVGGANDIVLKCVRAKRRVAWIHNDPTRHGLDRARCLGTYSDFDAVVNVSDGCKAIFDRIVPEFVPKSYVVHNLKDIEGTRRLAEQEAPYDTGIFNIVTVGRIDNSQKRMDRVVDCCAKLKSDGLSGFHWHVVGDGADLETVEQLAQDASVQDVLTFEGRKSNPFPYIKNADVLVLTSDYEAYPMVLNEALLLGTPAITTNYVGASEIVVDGRTGLITSLSVQGLTEAVVQVMRDGEVRRRLRQGCARAKVSNAQELGAFEEVVSGRRGA